MTPALSLAELLQELRLRAIRVWAEGGELRVRAPEGALTESLLGEVRRQKPELLLLLARGRGRTDAEPIPRRIEGSDLELSAAQRRLWVLEQMRVEGPSAYNISTAFIVRGTLDVPAFSAAFADVLARHEGLRIGVRDDGGEPRAVIAATPHFAADVADVSAERDPDAAFCREATRLAGAPFDLAAPPLVRLAVRQLAARRYGCVVVLHHLIADGASIPILMRDLAAAYRDRRGRRSPGQVAPRVQYADFAAWQNRLLDRGGLDPDRDFWRGQFRDVPEPLNLPTDISRPPVQSFTGGEVRLRLGRRATDQLATLATGQDATLFMTVLAAVAVLLQRYTGQDDVTVGTPALGRSHPDLDGMVGCFVNTLPLRCRLDRREPFSALLRRVRDTVVAAFEHERYPFDRLVDDLAVRRDTGRSPLFDVMVSAAADTTPRLALDDLEVEPVDVTRGASQFDLSFNFAPSAQGLDGSVQYRTDLFRRERVERMAAHLTVLLEAVAVDAHAAVGDLPLLTPAEQRQVVVAFNETAAPYSAGDTLVSRFARQAAATPDAVSVRDGGRRWTYGEIDARSNRVAAHLARRGVAPESRVALLARRGELMMTGLLGILKAGGAYVPIQPTDPRRRIESLLDDCRPAVVLEEHDIARWSESDAKAPPVRLLPANLAYVLYTSGSTGKPKGVQIEHGSVVNRIEWMDRQYGLTRDDVILQKTPFTFDVSVWELFWWAFAGASVAFLPPDDEKDPGAIVDAVQGFGITRMHFVPSMLRTFLDHVGVCRDHDRLAALRDVFASGEALPASLVGHFQSVLGARHGTRLHNLYGPTEATVDVSFFECARLGSAAQVPIGAPIANTALYVLDRDLNPAPIGVPGELFIGGVNVGRGYLDRPDLTAERFIPDAWSGRPATRLYRTGDVSRWREDGDLEFLGRNDHQVKVRGNRIELAEIESALRAHPNVREAAVLLDDEDLVAYVEADPVPSTAAFRTFLAERLPAYMIPGRFAMVTAWPLTSSGKLNRRALTGLIAEGVEHTEPGRAPATEVERQLAGLFAMVLGLPEVGVDDDFFERGGHSLKAARVVGRARQDHGLDLTLRDLFTHPTVAALARCAEARQPVRGRPLQPVTRQADYLVSHAQRRLWLAEQRDPAAAAYNVAAAFLVRGDLDVTALAEAWRRLQHRHESLRTSFRFMHGEPRQEIVDAPEVQIDDAELPDGSFEHEAGRIAAIPFDLEVPPLVRMSVRRLGAQEYGWVIVLHHLICDGWSMPILVRELVTLYDDSRTGRPSHLAPLRIQYKDYASWQRALVDDASIEPSRRFWHTLFASVPPRLRLPSLGALEDPAALKADRVVTVVEAERAEAIRELGRRRGASVFMTLLALVKALLFRYTDQSDMTVGTVAAGRTHPDLEGQIGFYVNTLALRTKVEAAEPFSQFLDRVRVGTLDAFEHQLYPFDQLVDDLALPADGRFPLFDVLVVLQNNETAELQLPGLALRAVDLPAAGSKFDLSFHFAESHRGIELTLEFRTGRFGRGAIEGMGAAFGRLLDAVLADPSQPMSALPMPAGAVREETIVIASTFTAEPIEDALTFWMAQLGVSARVVFTTTGQVFQPLLDPAGPMSRNGLGANVLLLRLSDWMPRGPVGLRLDPAHVASLREHPAHRLPNGCTVAHLNAYETEDLYQEIFVDRVYAKHGIELRPGDVVFDVGANIGMFTLFARSCADVSVYSFEPAPPAFDALRRNAAAYCPGARVFHCGVGARDGEAPFTFYPRSSVFSGYHPDSAADEAAIRAVVRNVVDREGVAPEAAAAATDLLMTDRLETETVAVPVRSLSSLVREFGVDHIDLLKIDAEKSECEILAGIDDEVWPRIRQLVIEIHDRDGATVESVAAQVRARGFTVAVEEEARLAQSGLYTLYGRRQTATRPAGELGARIADLCDALRAAALRAPATPLVVIACPEFDPRETQDEAQLAAGLATIPGVTFVPSRELARLYPVETPHDPRSDALGLVPYTAEQYAALATMIVRRMHAARRPPFKVIALDADQTLWRGVVGEDGPDGISIDPPRRALQQFMAEQRRDGMLLCLVSKNEESDVARAFASHPEMPLRLEDFSARRVNWQAKSANLRSLAAQLEVGLDSFVFVDDSPLECAEVRAACPEVQALCLPPADRIPEFLRATWAFDRHGVTAEDGRRADFYARAGDRDRLRDEAPTLGAFLAALDLTVEIARLEDADVPRAAQLTQRTNQFNTTTVRRSDAEIRALAGTGALLWTVRVRDRFGDYGLVGLIITSVGADSLVADAVMLSCRALGRGVEHRMVVHLGEEAARRSLPHVDLLWSATPKNQPVRDFLGALPGAAKLNGRYRLSAEAAARVVLEVSASPLPTGPSATGTAVAPATAWTTSAPEVEWLGASAIARAARTFAAAHTGGVAPSRRANLVAPRTAVERGLAEIWSEVLGVGDVGTNESFMELGGHSLKAIRMLSRAAQRLGLDLTLADLFAEPTIAGLAGRAASRDPISRTPIPPVGPQSTYALSDAQRRMWILHEMSRAGAVAYNNSSAFVIDGELSPGALAEAFSRLVRRHESLRTRIVLVDGEPRQDIVADPPFVLDSTQLAPTTEAAFAIDAARLAHEPLDFAVAPLCRAVLRRLDDGRWGLAIVIHHIVTDGWSMPILVRDLMACYEDARAGRVADRAPLRIQYKDYVAWHQELLRSPAMSSHQRFWHDRFATPPPTLDLPGDGVRPAMPAFRGDHLSHQLDRELTSALQTLATSRGTTLFMTLLSALQVLLFRYTGETDLTVGTPMTGRVHADLEDQVGLFVNTLALRGRVAPRESFAAVLDRARAETAAAFEHQAYPFDRLVDELRLPRDLGRSPLFDIMLVVEQDEPVALGFSGVEVRPLPLHHEVSRFDLTVHAVETDGRLSLGMQYRSDLFRRERIEAMTRHLERVLREAVRDCHQAIGDLRILDEAERRRLLQECGQGAGRAQRRTPARGRTLVDLFGEQVARTPDGIAVLAPGESPLTYRDLDERSNEIARHLAANGIRPEAAVAVLAARSAFAVAALLGVLKAGAAYVPLDPTLPQARLDYMIADCRAAMVLREPSAIDGGAAPCPPTADQLAYIIYTSGSTGAPKGVAVTHAALAGTALDQIAAFGLGPDDVIGQFASTAFDASLYETFLALLSGATLALVPDDARLDRERFLDWTTRVRPTVLVLSPTFVRALDRTELTSVRLLVTAGEAADPEDARFYAQTLRYVNAYGPTECAICAAWHEVGPLDAGTVAIGRPLTTTSAYVLDPAGELVPVGVAGELFLGGAGVARGYLGRPDLTAACFVPDSFGPEPGGRLYATGDRVRWRGDGTLEFLGRRDFQVKVRGHRIELGEVEAALRTCEGVRDAVVVAGGHGLVAYVLGMPDTVDAVKGHIRARLPEYMVPSHVVPLDVFPLTASGKVDRRALPAPEVTRPSLSAEYLGPSSAIEETIAAAWCNALGLPRVGVFDNFFDLGGNSILLTRVLSAIRRDVARDLSLVDLFTYPRIRDLAEHLAAGGEEQGGAGARAEAAERAAKQRAAFTRARRPRP